jgi:hypothetical protein
MQDFILWWVVVYDKYKTALVSDPRHRITHSCGFLIETKNRAVGAWSNYPVPLWLMRLQHWYCNIWVWQLCQVAVC